MARNRDRGASRKKKREGTSFVIEVIAGEGDFEYADCKGKYFYKQVSHFLKFSVRNPTCERVRKAASELLGKYVGEHHIELVNTRLYRFVPRMNI